MATVHSFPLTCPKCRIPLRWEMLNQADPIPCPSCRTELLALGFPALVARVAQGQPGEKLVSDADASCFYHPTKKATILCEGCGRFLCALCDIELSNQHLCPTCVETGSRKEKLQDLSRRRVLYDDVALAVALLPVLFWPLTLITAPIALFLAIRYWKAKSSIVPRTKMRFLVAIFFASLQVAGWATFFFFKFAR